MCKTATVRCDTGNTDATKPIKRYVNVYGDHYQQKKKQAQVTVRVKEKKQKLAHICKKNIQRPEKNLSSRIKIHVKVTFICVILMRTEKTLPL